MSDSDTGEMCCCRSKKKSYRTGEKYVVPDENAARNDVDTSGNIRSEVKISSEPVKHSCGNAGSGVTISSEAVKHSGGNIGSEVKISVDPVKHSNGEALGAHDNIKRNPKNAEVKAVAVPVAESHNSSTMSAEEMASVVSRLEKVTTRLESMAVKSTAGGAAGSADADEPEFVGEYDELMRGPLANYIALSTKISAEVKQQADKVLSGFQAQRAFLVQVGKCKLPPQNVLMEMLKPTSEAISAVQDIKEKNRGSSMTNHLSDISESISALGWVTVAPKPVPYIKEQFDAGMFWGNRVIRDYKGKDELHVDWVRAWSKTLIDLQEFVKDRFTIGIQWNPQGGTASGAAAPVKSVGAAPPPPGPPPPPPPPVCAPAGGGGEESDRAALFADLSRGGDVTKGLKTVTNAMKTHKNPALREGPAPFKPTKPTKPSPTAPKKAAPIDKPPVFTLDGKKWLVEYQRGNRDLMITETNTSQSVYVFKCMDSTIQVKGKVNSIILDNCKKVGVVLDDVISSVEFINCQSMQGQVTGKVPTISIDKTDGCMLYLSKESLSTEIVTAKSSEMNILIPGPDGDYVEYSIPEQFKSKWDGKKLRTACTDINQ